LAFCGCSRGQLEVPLNPINDLGPGCWWAGDPLGTIPGYVSHGLGTPTHGRSPLGKYSISARTSILGVFFRETWREKMVVGSATGKSSQGPVHELTQGADGGLACGGSREGVFPKIPTALCDPSSSDADESGWLFPGPGKPRPPWAVRLMPCGSRSAHLNILFVQR
jgi:hypothetical protein